MRNQEGKLYLLDFGTVKQIAAGGGKQQKSTGIYSIIFALPEQISGSQVYPSTDIYALAVTCIVLLTGKPAEELYDLFNYSWKWQNYAPKISDNLVDTFNKMLLPTPAQRFQSASEALTVLTVNSSPPIQRNKRNFSLVEVLGSAAFTGFEGALFYIGLTSAFSVSGVSLGIFGMVMGGFIFALNRRIIEKIDLLIFASITVALIYFVPAFQGALGVQSVLVMAAMSAAGAIAITAFFRLIHQLLSRFL